jgi:DNA-directed RNA polymerase specialized sigma24 family protein
MFDLPPDLSPDLDWMLKSSQPDEVMILEAVVHEVYAQVFHLALSLLDDPGGASQVALETISEISSKRHRFLTGQGVKHHIISLTIETCRRYRRKTLTRKLSKRFDRIRTKKFFARQNSSGDDVTRRKPLVPYPGKNSTRKNDLAWFSVNALGDVLRIPLILYCAHQLTVGEIAQVLRISQKTVRVRLYKAHDKLDKRLVPGPRQVSDGEPKTPAAPLGQAHLRARYLMQGARESDGLASGGLPEERQYLENHLSNCEDCRAYASNLVKTDEFLFRSFKEQWPSIQLSPEEEQAIVALAAARSSRLRMQRNWLAYAQRALLVGAAVILILAAGWLTRTTSPVKLVQIPTPRPTQVLRQAVLPTGTLALPTPSSQVSLVPLTENSDPQEILQRMRASRGLWQSLWADALIIRYGPPGYVGPPQFFRNQIWIGESDQKVVIAGPSDEAPTYAMLIDASSVYELELESGISYYYVVHPWVAFLPGEARPHFLGTYGYDTRGILDGSYVSRLLFPSELAQNAWKIWVEGSEKMLGRDVLVLEVMRGDVVRSQVWVDARTGVILRWIKYDERQQWTVSEEITLTSLQYNIDFPDQLFNSTPDPEKFVWENSWRPLLSSGPVPTPIWPEPSGRIPVGPPLADLQLDPRFPTPSPQEIANSRLVFEWEPWKVYSYRFGYGVSSIPTGEIADLFAGFNSYPNYLGQVKMGNPWNLFCERSPDGEVIAFDDPPPGPDGLFFSSTAPSYVHLDDAGIVHNALYNALRASNDFAFSPDSRYLAFWGCGGRPDNCGIYIHNLETQINKKLAALPHGATFFTWSPDGEYLALVSLDATIDSPQISSLLVLRLSSGQVVYKGVFDWRDESIPQDSPVQSWGVQFPPVRTGLDGCIDPPGAYSN